jgi:hypothetical protein
VPAHPFSFDKDYFSIYLGWITVATIANASDVLYYVRWSGWGLSPEIRFIIDMLAAAIASVVSVTRGDLAYMLVIVWAFVGIAVKQAGNPVVGTTTWLRTGVVVVMLLAGSWVNRRRGNQSVLPAG